MLIKQSYDVHVKTIVRWLYFDSLHSYCYFFKTSERHCATENSPTENITKWSTLVLRTLKVRYVLQCLSFFYYQCMKRIDEVFRKFILIR